MSYGSPNDKQLEHYDSIAGNTTKILARRDIYRLELNKLGNAVDEMIDTDDTGIIYAALASGIFKQTTDLLRAVPAAVDSSNFEAIFNSAMVIVEQITIYHDGVLLFRTGSDLVSKADLVAAHAVIKKGLTFLRSFTSILNVRNEHASDVQYERAGLKLVGSSAEKLASIEASRAVEREMAARAERAEKERDDDDGYEDDGNGEPVEA